MMDTRRLLKVRRFSFVLLLLAAFALLGNTAPSSSSSQAAVPAPPSGEPKELSSGPILVLQMASPITPATDDYLKSALQRAEAQGARLVLITLNTPGGVLTSTQSMVEQLLASPVPTAIFVSPAGGSATSAGVFITLAANFAVMAPGTTIGAAHPVSGAGQDIQGDMRQKIENFAVSHIKAIAEQRSRNTAWAEKAVRESVSITDREAATEKVVDFVAEDLGDLLTQLEGRSTVVRGQKVILRNLKGSSLETVEMTVRQRVVSFLSDPNVAILLGMAAMLGLAVEFYNPGLIVPGVIGVICLVLSLVAGQVLPINYGGLALMFLGTVFFIVELFTPTFGLWGAVGLVCLILGAIYFVDTDAVWSSSGFKVNAALVGTTGLVLGVALVGLCYLAMQARTRRSVVGTDGLIGQVGVIREQAEGGELRAFVAGEYWKVRARDGASSFALGTRVRVTGKDQDFTLIVETA